MLKVSALRKKFPKLKAISISTDVMKFFGDYVSSNSAREFILGWIFQLRKFNIDGIDLNFGDIQEK